MHISRELLIYVCRMILRSQLEILLRHPELFVVHESDVAPVMDYSRMKDEDSSHKSPVPITSPRYLETGTSLTP